MPASEATETHMDAAAAVTDEPGIDALLSRLETAVDAISDAYRGACQASDRAESAMEALRDAAPEGAMTEDFESRLTDLSTENRRLRELLEEARVRAERIRNQLALVEDEV